MTPRWKIPRSDSFWLAKSISLSDFVRTCVYLYSIKYCRWQISFSCDQLLLDSQALVVWVLVSMEGPSATNEKRPMAILYLTEEELGKGNSRAGGFSSSMTLSNSQVSFLSTFVLFTLPYGPVRAPDSWRCHEWRPKRGHLLPVPPVMRKEQLARGLPLAFSPHAHAGTGLRDSHDLKGGAAAGREIKVRILLVWWLVLCVNLAKL